MIFYILSVLLIVVSERSTSKPFFHQAFIHCCLTRLLRHNVPYLRRPASTRRTVERTTAYAAANSNLLSAFKFNFSVFTKTSLRYAYQPLYSQVESKTPPFQACTLLYAIIAVLSKNKQILYLYSLLNFQFIFF